MFNWFKRDATPKPKIIRITLPDEFTHRPVTYRESWMQDCCAQYLGVASQRDAYLGVDFARSGDLTVFWLLEQQQDLKLDTPLVVELKNVPFEQQKQALFWLIDRLPRFGAGALDARGNGQYLAEVAQQRYGAGRIAQVMLSADWYRDNMPRLKAHLEDGTLSLLKDSDILDDLRAVRMDKGIAKVPDRTGQQGRHGDAAVALALAIHAASQLQAAPIEYSTIGAKADRWINAKGAW
jgi:phage FluMu gp28-like protein